VASIITKLLAQFGNAWRIMRSTKKLLSNHTSHLSQPCRFSWHSHSYSNYHHLCQRNVSIVLILATPLAYLLLHFKRKAHDASVEARRVERLQPRPGSNP